MACTVASESPGVFAGARMPSQQEGPFADAIASTSASQVAAKPFKLYAPTKNSKPKQVPPSQLSLMIQLAVAQRENRKLQNENEQLKAANALQMEHHTNHMKQLQEQLQQKDAELLQQQRQLATCQEQVDLKQQRLNRLQEDVEHHKATTAALRQQCDTQQVQMGVLEDLLAVRPEPQPKAPTFLDIITSALPAAIATSWPVASSSKPHANSAELAAAAAADDDDDDFVRWLADTRGIVLESFESTEYPGTPTAAVSRPAPGPRSSNSSSSSDSSSSSNVRLPAAIATSWPVASSSKPQANSAELAAAAAEADDDADDDFVRWLADTRGIVLESFHSTEYPETPRAAVSRPAPSPRSSNSSSSSDSRSSSNGSSCSGNLEEQNVPEASSWWWWGSRATSSTTNGHSEGSNDGSGSMLSRWWVQKPQIDTPAGAAADSMYV